MDGRDAISDTRDEAPAGRFHAGVMAVFVAFALLAALDVASDLREGTTLTHVSVELAIMAVAIAGAVIVARQLSRTLRRAREVEREARDLAERLTASQAEAAHWRAEAGDLLKGLAVALDRQFERWQLSAAEKEVALLLLKGLSHREIAELRAVTEATARQQARAVYKKAGLAGRADLAAFFLEDLMLPSTATSAGT